MQCAYFDAGVCRSCTHMGVPYPVHLAGKQRQCAGLLAPWVAQSAWLEPFTGPEARFRNKAKLVAGGRRGAVTLGILDAAGHGVDLRGCGLYEPGLSAALPALSSFVDAVGLEPYSVPQRRGELKNLLVTHAPDGQLMVRFVLRSRRHEALLRGRLPKLLEAVPQVAVASINLHPTHSATLEGDTELPLTQQQALPMPLGSVTLHLRPNSFFQTNTSVARGLYEQARVWVGERDPDSVLDLYCGVGGFALHAATALAGPARVRGIELSEQAIASARLSWDSLSREGRVAPGVEVEFVAGDATRLMSLPPGARTLCVLNPPRRGIGAELAAWLETGTARTVLYSSCNATTLARDLAAMPSFTVRAARLFDMFPQTDHHEVLVLLER